jgi:hypothetical protein
MASLVYMNFLQRCANSCAQADLEWSDAYRRTNGLDEKWCPRRGNRRNCESESDPALADDASFDEKRRQTSAYFSREWDILAEA